MDQTTDRLAGSAMMTDRCEQALSLEVLRETPDDFLAHDPEGAAFYQAFQRAGVDGFHLGCLRVCRHGRPISTVPYFVMKFTVSTMLPDGWLKRLLAPVRFAIACVGHPSADCGRIHGELSAEALHLVNDALSRRAALVCYKGFGPDLPLSGFVRVRGLPIPVLQVTSEYWAKLGSRKRNDLKRKLKSSANLRFEETDGLPEVYIDRVLELYLQTHERAEIRFERLNRDYFVETAPISKYLLFFERDLLIGFAQTLCGDGRMVHKYVGMDYARNRQYRLYFALFLKAIDICIRDGLAEIDSGVTGYEFKQYLGSKLHETWIYYHHRNPLLNWLLARFGFLLEPTEAELR